MPELSKPFVWTYERAQNGIHKLYEITRDVLSWSLDMVTRPLRAAWETVKSALENLKSWLQSRFPKAGPIVLTGAGAITFSRAIGAICARVGLLIGSTTAALAGLSAAVLLSTI
jgi:hypothetical protein